MKRVAQKQTRLSFFIVFSIYIYIERERSFCPFGENNSRRTRFLYIALGINECQVFISTINIKGGGGGGAGECLGKSFGSKFQNPLFYGSQAPCFMVFTCRVSLSDSLESEASLQSSL